MVWLARKFGKKQEAVKPSPNRLSAQWFSEKELRCKGAGTCTCNGAMKLNPIFDAQLAELRNKFGMPMHVNSCCRCASWNKIVKGHPRSLHISDDEKGGACAIDIKRQGGMYDETLAKLAYHLGFSIGVHPHFLHLDVRSMVIGKPKVVFPYSETGKVELEHYKQLVKGELKWER